MLQLLGVLLAVEVLVVLDSINNNSSNSSKEVNLKVQREGVQGVEVMVMRHVEEGTSHHIRSVLSNFDSVYGVLSRFKRQLQMVLLLSERAGAAYWHVCA
jgi:vacuolar-type H+-ATPase subunit D/Vma8